jgi:hypothetical protein
MTNIEKLKALIIKNKAISIDIAKGADSSNNSSITIVSGYADYIAATVEEVETAIMEVYKYDLLNAEIIKEIERVFDFAKVYNYGNFWKTEQAQKEYIF